MVKALDDNGVIVGKKYDRQKIKTWFRCFKKRKKPSSKEISRQQQLTEELYKRIKTDFTRRRVIVNHIDEIWSKYLVDMQQFSKYKYLLMATDVFSKYGWIRPSQNLWVDKGKEFYIKHLKELLEKHNTAVYSTENGEKSNVIER